MDDAVPRDRVQYEIDNRILHRLPPLHAAAARGDIEAIREELNAGVSVNLRLVDGPTVYRDSTPLTWAAISGQAEAAKLLLLHGAEVDARMVGGVTPLMLAAGSPASFGGDPLGCIDSLLEHGADLHAVSSGGLTALSMACAGGAAIFYPLDGRLVDMELLRPGFGGAGNVPFRDDRMTRETRYGGADRVRRLLEAGADANGGGARRPPLEYAAVQAESERVQLLLKSGSSVHKNMLVLALLEGTADVFTMLLETREGRDILMDNATEFLTRAAGSRRAGGEKVRAILATGVDIQSLPNGGRELFLTATHPNSQSDGTSIAALIEAGVHPIPFEGHGNLSLLIAAAAFTGAPGLETLLEHGGDPNERSGTPGHPTVLMLAAASEQDAAEKVRILLNAGADIHAESERGESALLYAARAGNMDAVILLVEAGANVNIIEPERGSAPVRGGSFIVRIPGATPLIYVANRGMDPLMMSKQKGGSATRALLRAGADANVRVQSGETAFSLALQARHGEVLSVLIEAEGLPADVRTRQELVEIAVRSGDAASLSLLLDHGINPDIDVWATAENLRIPALAYACMYARLDIVTLLLEAGANIHAPDSRGMTPLMAAVQPVELSEIRIERTLDIIETLLRAGADIARRDHQDRTALMLALARRTELWGPDDARIIERLLLAGAAVNDQDRHGMTPLHHAALGGPFLGSILLVHRAGADIHAVDSQGRTAFDAARERWATGTGRNYTPVIRYLEREMLRR